MAIFELYATTPLSKIGGNNWEKWEIQCTHGTKRIRPQLAFAVWIPPWIRTFWRIKSFKIRKFALFLSTHKSSKKSWSPHFYFWQPDARFFSLKRSIFSAFVVWSKSVGTMTFLRSKLVLGPSFMASAVTNSWPNNIIVITKINQINYLINY